MVVYPGWMLWGGKDVISTPLQSSPLGHVTLTNLQCEGKVEREAWSRKMQVHEVGNITG